ncbi:class I SAM-dependent methyltransferase [Pelobium sp.]|nr:class I SAM-dependent methyltransferase [Pelobium sp.]MDA9554651.1 class I SAM-dependent methyltransferase [Pelobium sp.]
MDIEFLQNGICRLCIQPRTFEFISNRMHGLDPVELLNLLNELTETEKLRKENEYWIVNEEKLWTLGIDEPQLMPYFKKYMGHFDFLKNPHPLDFEWRNTNKSLNYLTELLINLNRPEDSVLLMGMPTLFANLCVKDIPQKIKLVERNEPIIEALSKITNDRTKIIKADIFKAKSSDIGKHHCVIMDPPWYTQHLFQFVWLAAKCLNIGGTMIISIPPINTRPNIDKERIEWFAFCQKQGLCIENLYSSKLQYAMPFFEFNALRTAGVKNILPFWRTGDVVTFKKMRNTDTERMPLEELTSEWQEQIIEGIRIRVNLSIEDKADLSINSLVPLDILPSVSSREPIRKKANLFTSGNRIFDVSRPKEFLKYLKTFSHPINDSENEKIIHDFIKEIINFEQQEFNEYLECIYYEMERQSL